jgi:hypothetical protein
MQDLSQPAKVSPFEDRLRLRRKRLDFVERA